MKIYLAGPLFTEAERAFLESIAVMLEAEGLECFVPHRQHFDSIDPDTIFAADAAGVRSANALVAWLDGPVIDDGTAAEIGIFTELCRRDPEQHWGIVGFTNDWRTMRRRESGAVADGLNLFVVGAIRSCGSVVYNVDDMVAELVALRQIHKRA